MCGDEIITIVSGLPRSGTSMMMKILEAGGMEVLTDNIRKADEDNPRGYYEFELVKKVKEDASWLENANGKAVKMVSKLLCDLPANKHYKVIFMRRRMEEILASQRKMLERKGIYKDEIDDTEMASLFYTHLKQTEKWLQNQENFEVLYISYNDVLENPEVNLQKLNHFMEDQLNFGKMKMAIDKTLYRNRKRHNKDAVLKIT